jgi:Tfp pilus assembly protein PilP
MEVYNRVEKGMRAFVVCCFAGALFAGSSFAAPPAQNPPVNVLPSPFQQPGTQTPTPPSAEELASNRQKILEALMQPSFAYSPNRSIDPFIPFVTPETGRPPGAVGAEEIELPPEQQKPLTPLQKMSLGEIQKGLKAIVWGDMGRKAIIEDGAGKGYIVSMGTPAGDKDGMIVDIFNDRIVIKQNVWDQKQKRMLAQNSVVKLKKEKEK